MTAYYLVVFRRVLFKAYDVFTSKTCYLDPQVVHNTCPRVSGRGAGVRKSLPSRGAAPAEDALAAAPAVIPNQVTTYAMISILTTFHYIIVIFRFETTLSDHTRDFILKYSRLIA